MARKYASGKHSKAVCDRCGTKHDYDQLILEWTGLRVCRLYARKQASSNLLSDW